ncbi:hypothetical protein UPYG_G00332020 [Umbra pygmaea]|uniref:C-type lectin domain-containing protein n=1 Tax=Umbra pygmaea TaxID=75934 RepID=A0ABD0WGU8_UMBPY
MYEPVTVCKGRHFADRMEDEITDNILVNYDGCLYSSTDRGNWIKGNPGSSPKTWAPHLVSRRFHVLLAVLCVTLICSLCVLGTIGVLYASKSNQFESLKAQHRNLSERQTGVKCYKRCAEGWVYQQEKCYFFSTDEMNWNQSRGQCVSMGGDLVIINSQKEQKYLKSMNATFWIGLNDLETEGWWLWVDNKPLSQTGLKFWIIWDLIHSEPDNSKTIDPLGENCATLFMKSRFSGWADVSCEQMHRFVCETSSNC